MVIRKVLQRSLDDENQRNHRNSNDLCLFLSSGHSKISEFANLFDRCSWAIHDIVWAIVSDYLFFVYFHKRTEYENREQKRQMSYLIEYSEQAEKLFRDSKI